MTLYTKYRPDDFEDMVGNAAAIASLEKAITKKNHSHVYLLSGPPGTGKTTIARIMARKLGASDMDVREINTASARGIDTAREIIQQMRMLPMDGSAIIYILDECHKFTADMQNALLKPLEDTPEHVYFFLCTTDPQKLIAAVKSRCTHVKTSPLTDKELLKILQRVNKLEKLGVDSDTLDLIAEAAEGSPRKALVLLERIAAVDDEKDRRAILRSADTAEDDPEVIELCRALINPKTGWSDVAKILKTLKDANKLDDAETVRYIALGYANAILLSGKVNQRAVAMLEAFSEPTYNTGKVGITLACLNVIM